MFLDYNFSENCRLQLYSWNHVEPVGGLVPTFESQKQAEPGIPFDGNEGMIEFFLVWWLASRKVMRVNSKCSVLYGACFQRKNKAQPFSLFSFDLSRNIERSLLYFMPARNKGKSSQYALLHDKERALLVFNSLQTANCSSVASKF